MKEFEVPQLEVPATVGLHDGTRIQGAFFAPPAGPDGHRSRLLARLNEDPDDFLPFVCSGRHELLNRRWIAVVSVSADEVYDPALGADTEHRLRVELSTGGSITGGVRYAMRVERRRLSDFLNAAPRFIAVHDGPGATLVHRAFIVRVEDLA